MSEIEIRSGGKPQIIVICPVFNEEKTVPLFFERLRKVRQTTLDRYEMLLVFVDNCSSDSTPDVIRKLGLEFPWVGHLRLSQNYGYQRSLESGLRSSFGDYYCFIDVDCEDPPEMLLDFLKEIENGYGVVYGERVDREEAASIKWMRKQYYRVTKMASDERFNLYMAEFSMFTRAVRDALIQDTNSFPFFRASIARVGFRQKGIAYKRHLRIAGETHYNFLSMAAFGLGGILSSSTLLLRLTAYAFVPWFFILNFFFAAGFFWETTSYYWGAVWISMIYFGLALASLAIYIARTYKNTLNRPNYFVDIKGSLLRPFLKVQ